MDALVRRLREHRKSGVYRSAAAPDELTAAARAAGFALFRIDATPVRTKSKLLAQIARALDFPAWAGRNWDALEDCVTDLGWIDAPGIVIEFAALDAYAKADPEGFVILVDIFKAAAEYWRSQHKPFWVIFAGPAAGRLELPVLVQ
jgi:RNAse (barnase) inhibitor barstar